MRRPAPNPGKPESLTRQSNVLTSKPISLDLNILIGVLSTVSKEVELVMDSSLSRFFISSTAVTLTLFVSLSDSFYSTAMLLPPRGNGEPTTSWGSVEWSYQSLHYYLREETHFIHFRFACLCVVNTVKMTVTHVTGVSRRYEVPERCRIAGKLVCIGQLSVPSVLIVCAHKREETRRHTSTQVC